MGYPINAPTYPVVDPEPTVSRTLAAFRRRDWANLALAVGVSAPFGYVVGRPVVMVPSMYVATAIGALGAMCVGMQSSFGRLTGYLENGPEVTSATQQH
jgi:hypothetical protein